VSAIYYNNIYLLILTLYILGQNQYQAIIYKLTLLYFDLSFKSYKIILIFIFLYR